MKIGFKKIIMKCIIISCIFFCVFTVCSIENQTTVKAGSWLTTDDSLYTNDDGGTDHTYGDEGETEGIDSDKPGFLEKLVISFFGSAAKFLNKWESNTGIDMTTVVMGRVGGHVDVSYFSFELRKGNVYGLVGSILYNIFRGIAIVGIIMIGFVNVVKATYAGNSARAMADFRNNFKNYVILVGLLFLMPNILDVWLYIRDNLLGLVGSITGTHDLLSVIADEAVWKKSWLTAGMYLGSGFLAIFFAYSYIMLALSLLIYFSVFPLVCVMSVLNKNLLTSWVGNVLSVTLTPVLDAGLLLIPSIVAVMLGDNANILKSLIIFMICSSIIPIRETLKSMFGLTGGGINGLANAGMQALGLMRAGGALAQGIGNGIKSTTGHLKNAKENSDLGKMEDEMSKAENGDSEESNAIRDENGTSSKKEWSSYDKDKDDNSNEEGLNMSDSDDLNGIQKPEGLDGEMESENEESGINIAQESPGMEPNSDSGLDGVDSEDEEITGGESGNSSLAMGPYRHAEDAKSNFSSQQKMANLDKQIAPMQSLYDRSKASEQDYSQQLSSAKAERQSYIDNNGSSTAELDQKVADAQNAYDDKHQSTIAIGNELGDLKNERAMTAADLQSQMSAQNYRDTSIASTQQQIAEKSANIGNFQRPEFKGISHAAKANLYKKAARRELFKAVGTGIGTTVGAATGATFGVGATMFASPQTSAMVTGALGGMGASVGSYMGSTMGAFADVSTHAAGINIKKAGNSVGGFMGRNVGNSVIYHSASLDNGPGSNVRNYSTTNWQQASDNWSNRLDDKMSSRNSAM